MTEPWPHALTSCGCLHKNYTEQASQHYSVDEEGFRKSHPHQRSYWQLMSTVGGEAIFLRGGARSVAHALMDGSTPMCTWEALPGLRGLKKTTTENTQNWEGVCSEG